MVYDRNEEFVTSYGKGLAPNVKIVSVAYYNDKLYALDAGNSRIRVLDPKTGEQTAVLGFIEQPNQSLRLPCNMTIRQKRAPSTSPTQATTR